MAGPAVLRGSFLLVRACWLSALQPSLRDWKICLSLYPPLKRWAFISRPYGTERSVCPSPHR